MQGRCRRRRRGDAGGAAGARGSESRRRQPDGVSSAIGARRRVGFVSAVKWLGMAKSRVDGAFFFDLWYRLGSTNRYQRCIGTGWWNQPVPKVHQKLRANRCTFGTGFSHQPVPKGFSLFFFSCFIKTIITFERKVQMT